MFSNVLNILGFFPNETRQQRVFDVIFGIIAPLLCLYFDPFIFRIPDGPCLFGPESPVTNQYASFAYTAIGLGILFLVIWLFGGIRLKKVSAFFAGIFFAGCAFSFLVGVYIFPFSLLGLLLMGLGVLGFIPFLTALVYLRNGIKALQWDREINANRLSIRVVLIILGAAIVLGLPAWIQMRYPPVIPVYDAELCSSE